MSLKRKAESALPTAPSKKRNADHSHSLRSAFTAELLDDSTVASYRETYSQSGPYPHAVVPKLIEDTLLRNVRSEISEHINFTLKETDIYRIHQSGDLANLSGLDSEDLKQLPSLVRLRDALYSPDFRTWVSNVTGAGLLSGEKTDMAVNVYTPGSYLLCHDDVIGSRRVSYILYLTDPDKPWRAEWGGGLRLFPTEVKQNSKGEDIRVPLAEHSLNIPPSFGQLSFFTVLPGESYHDVEEVYHPPNGQDTKMEDGGRIRMAISGWYHIPQAGEEGYEEGLEQAQAQRSSLTQLKSASGEFDEPQPRYKHYDEARTVPNSSATAIEIDPGDDSDTDPDDLSEQDLTFLLQYISPGFLTPDRTEECKEFFSSNFLLNLESFFCDKFANELKAHIENADQAESSWRVARPPHKHRFAYLQGDETLHDDANPIARILTDLIHSHAFKKWLAIVTGVKPAAMTRQDVLARRFRRGKDYALASSYSLEQPQLEFTIGMTPSDGWQRDEDPETEGQEDVEVSSTTPAAPVATSNGMSNGNHRSSAAGAPEIQVSTSDLPEYGGEEIYLAGDDEEADDNIDEASNQKTGPGTSKDTKTNGSTPLPQVGRKSVDPAVYNSTTEDEGDSILFVNAPSWNKFSIVLRDKGSLRFVKYVSQAAKGDRWDVKGTVELAEDAFDDEEEDAELETGDLADEEDVLANVDNDSIGDADAGDD